MDSRPDSPCTTSRRSVSAVGPRMPIRARRPTSISARTHSAAVRVLPAPRPPRFSHVRHALLPRFARLTALLQVMDRKKGGSGDGAFAAAKAMEVMGGMIDERQVDGRTVREINPELMQQRLDMMARVAVATNSRIGPQDYLGFAKQARVAGMNLSDSFIYERLPAIMLGMGRPARRHSPDGDGAGVRGREVD